MTAVEKFKEDLLKLITHLGDQRDGGSLAISFSPGDEQVPWSVSYAFGREEEDSDIVGGASYGVGRREEEAVAAVVEELGL